jgi:TusA-related sulfurtransferase
MQEINVSRDEVLKIETSDVGVETDIPEIPKEQSLSQLIKKNNKNANNNKESKTV